MLNDRYPVTVLELEKPDGIYQTVEDVGDGGFKSEAQQRYDLSVTGS